MYTPVPTVTTGDLWTAANHNTYIRDNFAAGVPAIIQAKGDLVLGTNLQQIARLPVGANGTYLRADSSQPLGVKWASPFPAGTNGQYLQADSSQPLGVKWAAIPSPFPAGTNGQYLQADSSQPMGVKWASITFPVHPPVALQYQRTTQWVTSSTTYVDDTTRSLVIAKRSTIFVFLTGVFRPTQLYGVADARIVANGVASQPSYKSCNHTDIDISWTPFSCGMVLTGVAAGTIPIKVQFRQGFSGGAGNVELERYTLIALAFREV